MGPPCLWQKGLFYLQQKSGHFYCVKSGHFYCDTTLLFYSLAMAHGQGYNLPSTPLPPRLDYLWMPNGPIVPTAARPS
jgi:hypothetical protein